MQVKKDIIWSQASARYERIDHYLLGLGFHKNDADPNLYFKVNDDKVLILVPYIDVLFLTSDDVPTIKCKKDLKLKFEMKDLGLLHYFLGIEVCKRSNGIILSQGMQ